MTTAYHDILELAVGGYWWGDDPEQDPANRVAEHLTYIGDVDLAVPDYSFDLLRFYVRKSDGVVLYGTDSGCSCPSPFESVTVGELKETTLAGVEDVARSVSHYEHHEEDDYSWSYGRQVALVLQDVRALLPKMREAGAK